MITSLIFLNIRYSIASLPLFSNELLATILNQLLQLVEVENFINSVKTADTMAVLH